MFGFKGVRGWVLVAAVCGIAAGASAVRAFQPTGPAVGTGAMPLKTLFAQIVLATKDQPQCSQYCALSGAVQVLEVPQGQTLVVTDLSTFALGSGSIPWPEKINVPTLAPYTKDNTALSVCVAADGVPLFCVGQSQVVYGGNHLNTGLAIPSGSKVELWARMQSTNSSEVQYAKVPVLATGYLIRN